MKQSWPLIALLALCALAFAYLIGLKHGREDQTQQISRNAQIYRESASNVGYEYINEGAEGARNVPFYAHGAAQPAFPPQMTLPSL